MRAKARGYRMSENRQPHPRVRKHQAAAYFRERTG